MHMETKVHMKLRYFVVLTWMCDKRGLVQYVTLWNNPNHNIAMLKLMISYIGHESFAKLAYICKAQAF